MKMENIFKTVLTDMQKIVLQVFIIILNNNIFWFYSGSVYMQIWRRRLHLLMFLDLQPSALCSDMQSK